MRLTVIDAQRVPVGTSYSSSVRPSGTAQGSLGGDPALWVTAAPGSFPAPAGRRPGACRHVVEAGAVAAAAAAAWLLVCLGPLSAVSGARRHPDTGSRFFF